MIKRIATPVCLALIALAASVSQASSASAAVGAFVLNNPTRARINYTVVWSDGDVQYVTLEPGESHYHSCTLDAWGQMPSPTIMFDDRLNDSVNTVTSYQLDSYRVSDPNDGKDYTFTLSGSNIGLYAG
jgi:hypothetical protein